MPGGRWRTPRLLAVITSVAGVEIALVAAGLRSGQALVALPARLRELAPVFADVATLVALAAWSWLTLTTMLTAAVALRRTGPGSAAALLRRIAPVTARHAVLAVLGFGALALPATAAIAAARGYERPDVIAALGMRCGSTLSAPPAALLEGLRLPDRPTGRSQPPEPPGQPDPVVVRPGDTLWSIAAQALGRNATAAAIAAAWPSWYAANRQAIGPDPDLIHPGTVLHPPAPAPSHRLRPDERS